MTVSGVMAVLVCFFALVGFCVCAYWIGKSITGKDEGGLVEESQPDKVKAEYSAEVEILNQLYSSLKPLLDRLEPYCNTPKFVGLGPTADSFFIRETIRCALETGIAYKRQYEALQKSEDLKLRKYCFEQFKDFTTPYRMECSQKLYEYLKTGNLPEKEKEEKTC